MVFANSLSDLDVAFPPALAVSHYKVGVPVEMKDLFARRHASICGSPAPRRPASRDDLFHSRQGFPLMWCVVVPGEQERTG
jgi:hypothetical protein